MVFVQPGPDFFLKHFIELESLKAIGLFTAKSFVGCSKFRSYQLSQLVIKTPTRLFSVAALQFDVGLFIIALAYVAMPFVCLSPAFEIIREV